jgi:hypothetical protein
MKSQKKTLMSKAASRPKLIQKMAALKDPQILMDHARFARGACHRSRSDKTGVRPHGPYVEKRHSEQRSTKSSSPVLSSLQKKPSESSRFQSWDKRRRCSAVWSDNIAFILCLFLKRLRSIPAAGK